MQDTIKILVFIASNPAMEKSLPAHRLAEKIADRGWLVSIAAADPPYNAIEALLETCRKQQPDGVVAAGPLSFLDRIPDVIETELRGGLQPIPVNLAECCAFLHADQADALSSAERQIDVAVARCVSCQPIEWVERPVRRVVLVVGTGDSGAQIATCLLSHGLAVIALAQGPEPQRPMPEAVELITSANLQSLSGLPGDLEVGISRPEGVLTKRVGAVIVAQEAQQGRPPLSDLTLADKRVKRLNDPAAGDKTERHPGVRSLAFLLDLEFPESRTVAAQVRRLALEAAANGVAVTVFYRHAAVHGRTGQLEYDQMRQSGVQMFRYDRQPVVEPLDNGVHLVGRDMILGEAAVEVTVDRLIVANPLQPSPISEELARRLHQPVDREGFLQPANVRYLPVGSPRKGVYFAGSGRQDLSASEARLEAAAVAGQAAALLSVSSMREPKALALYDRDLCAMCLTCLRGCYHGAIRLSENGGSVCFEPGACWECGLCASVCPQKAITRLSSPETKLHAAIQTAGKTLEGEAPVVAFLCRNSPALALLRAGQLGLRLPRQVVVVEVPCAGYISPSEALAALNAGADRVIVAACHEDNCRSLQGATSACSRSKQVMDDLDALGLLHDRVTFAGVAANEPFRLIDILSGSATVKGRKEVANV